MTTDAPTTAHVDVRPPQFDGHSMSEAEFAALPDDGYRYEYVEGVATVMSPAGGRHGGIGTRLTFALFKSFEEQDVNHHVFDSSTGYRLPNGDVRVPDLAVILAGRLSSEEEPIGFIDLASDLAVEIGSPSDRYEDVQEKVREYLNWGVRAVWVVEPELRQVMSHSPAGVQRLADDATLDGGGAVPGFSCRLTDIFA